MGSKGLHKSILKALKKQILSDQKFHRVCGPQAVGKMTVAESIRDKLKYNLMLNHDSIEVSDKVFGFATPAQKEFNRFFREKAFEIAIKYDVDLIFTYVSDLDGADRKT